MNRICVSALALAMMAGVASAQQVQFRIVERTNQLIATSGDSLLELAVQARVVGGGMLGGYNFNITTNDAEANGTLQRARIMNGFVFGVGNTYFTGSPWTSGNTLGIHGIAGQYSYLAGINGQFNGLINASAGTFTDNPAINELGLIAGAATGTALTQTPGIDADGDGIPDTAPSNGGASQNNETAPVIDPTIRQQYFAENTFVDVYRFRYIVSNFAARTIHFGLTDVGAQTFNQLLFNNGAWGAQNNTVDSGSVSATGYDVLTPSPASVALMGLGGLMVARRRRA
jgi:hypothetical protein